MFGLHLTETNFLIGTIILGLLGIVNCFAGYRFFRLLLAVAGFITGAGLGLSLAPSLTGSSEQVLAILLAVLFGVIGAILFYFLYFVGTFLAGIGLGIVVGGLLTADLHVSGGSAELIVVVCAVLGGFLGFVLSKYIIMLATAIIGATQIATAVLLLFPGMHAIDRAGSVQFLFGQSESLLLTVAVVILAILGFFAQINYNRPLPAQVIQS